MLVQAQVSPATAQQGRERRLSVTWPNNPPHGLTTKR
jgi:hypothetical protein